MSHNSISEGMKFYALQIKQKSIAADSDGILRTFRSAFLKGNRRREVRAVTLAAPGFHCFQSSYLVNPEKIVFLSKFLHSVAFHFGLCY